MPKPARNSICPCGSRKKYKHCCLGKAFEIVDEDENNFTRTWPITGKLKEITAGLNKTFQKHFDRIPGEGDPMFLGKYLLGEQDVERGVIEAMEKTGVAPAYIYAYKRTGYLIVEGNEHVHTGYAIKEWESAVDEYNRIGAEPDEGPEAITFDKTLRALAEEFESHIFALGLASDKFFNTPLLNHGAEDAVAVLTPQQYQALCVSRVHRTLRSVLLLQEHRMSEDILKLARSIYESYLHMAIVGTDPSTMEVLVDSVVGVRQGTHEYRKKRDGTDDKRTIIEIATGREIQSQISAYKMAESSGITEDVRFFDFFYRTTSEFLHPSVFALDAYLSSNGLDPVKSHMHEEAIIFTACVSAMVIDAVTRISGCPAQVARDCLTVVTRTKSKIMQLLDQLDVWQEQMGATKHEISIIRARCERLGGA